jgi:ABC-type dipeptide/oligopeptide/nickel transport system permease subunit
MRKPLRTEYSTLGERDTSATEGNEKKEVGEQIRSFFGRAKSFWKKYSESRTAMLGLGILVFFVVLAISAPFIAMNPEQWSTPYYSPQPPSLVHILGTDEYGRDVFSRLVYGTGGTLVECLVALGISLSIGLVAGCLSGYFDGRFLARLLDRLAEVLLAVPFFLLIIADPFRVVGYAPLRTAITTGVWSWGITEKLVRPQALAAKGKAHVETARMLGASHLYVIRRHILPDCIPAMITGLIYTAVVAVGIQTAIDYIGINRMIYSIEEVRVAPFLTWGTILSYALLYAAEDPLSMWWLTLVPSVCIVLLMLSLVLIGQRVSAVITVRRGA